MNQLSSSAKPVCYCASAPFLSSIALLQPIRPTRPAQRAMAMFKAAAAELLKLLCAVFLFGHSYCVLPVNRASACGSDISLHVFVTHYFLFCATLTAAMLLLAVRMALNTAEDGATVKGIASIAAGWKRAALRGTLLLTVALSAAVAFLGVAAFEDGYRYRRGCAAGGVVDGSRSPMAVLLMAFMALLHGFFAY